MSAPAPSLVTRVTNAVFGVFSVLSSRPSRRGLVESSSPLLPFVAPLLLVIDAVQVVGLVVRTGQSWPAELANISEQVFGLLRILLALFQWQAIALTASMVIVWASLINAGLVAWAFAYNKHQWIFPIRTLGVLVAFATSIGFIPLLEQLLLAIADPSSLTSDSVGAVVLRAAAAVSAVLFVPFALTGSLLVFEGDPGSTSSSMRAPSGSINALVTTARCVFVVVAMFRFDANSTWLANFVFLVVAGVVLAAVVTRLPYYLHWPSRLQAALYAGIAWIALGTLVLDVVRRRLDGDELTNEATIMDIAVPWVIATPVAMFVGLRAVIVREAMVEATARDLIDVLSAVHARRQKAAAAMSPAHRGVRFGASAGVLRAPSGRGSLGGMSAQSLTVGSIVDAPSKGVPGALPAAEGGSSHEVVTLYSAPRGKSDPDMVVDDVPGEEGGGATDEKAPSQDVTGADTEDPQMRRGSAISFDERAGLAAGPKQDLPVELAMWRCCVRLSMCCRRSDSGVAPVAGNRTSSGQPLTAAASSSEVKSSGRNGLREVGSSLRIDVSARHGKEPPATDQQEAAAQPVFSADKALLAVVQDCPRARIVLAKLMTSPVLVELAARSALRWRGLSTSAKLAACFVIYEAGIACFPSGAGVRIHFARTVEATTADTHRALSLLRAAASCGPAFNERFAIFHRLKEAEQSRQTTSLGKSAHGLGSADYLEFKKLEKLATSSHIKAIKQLKRIWGRVAQWERQGTARPSETAMKPLAKRIRHLAHASDRATSAYVQLVSKYPRATPLLRQFGCFLLEVRSRPDGADALFARADEVEDEDSTVGLARAESGSSAAPKSVVSFGMSSAMQNALGGGSGTGGTSEGGSKQSMLSSEGSFAGLLERSHNKIRDDDFRAVADLQRGVGMGVLVMAGLMIGALGITVIMLDAFQSSINSTYMSAQRAERMQQGLYGARSVQLASAGVNDSLWNDYREATLDATTHADLANQELRASEGSGAVAMFMHSKPLLVHDARDAGAHRRQLGSDGAARSSPRLQGAERVSNPADLFQDSLMALRRIASESRRESLTLESVRLRPDWFFAMANVQQVLLPALAATTSLYELNDEALAVTFHAIQIGILVTLLLTNASIFVVIYRPAAHRVSRSAVSLMDVAPAIVSLRTAESMVSMYQRADRRMHGEEDAMESDDDDDEEEEEPGAPESEAAAGAAGAGSEEGGEIKDVVSASAVGSAGLLPGSAAVPGASTGKPLVAIAEEENGESAPQSPLSKAHGQVAAEAAEADRDASSSASARTFGDDGSRLGGTSGDGMDVTAAAEHRSAASSEPHSRQLPPVRRANQREAAGSHDPSLDELLRLPTPQHKAARTKLGCCVGVFDTASDGVPMHPTVRHVSMVSRVMIVVLFAIAGLQVITFTTAYSATELAAEEAAEIMAAASRSDAAMLAGMLLRELAIGDGEMVDPVSALVQARVAAAKARALHNSIRFGNARLHLHSSDQRYEPQRELLYGSGQATGTPPAHVLNTSSHLGVRTFLQQTKASLAEEIESFGLTAALNRYLSEAERMAASAAAALNVSIADFDAVSLIIAERNRAMILEGVTLRPDEHDDQATSLDTDGAVGPLGTNNTNSSAPNSTVAHAHLRGLGGAGSERGLSASSGHEAAPVPSDAELLPHVDAGGLNLTTYADWVVGHDLSELFSHEQYGHIGPAIEGPLMSALLQSIQLFREESEHTVQDELAVEASIMAANLTVLGLLYIMGLRAAIAALLQEAHLSHEFLDTLPVELLDEAPRDHAIHDFFMNGDDDDDDGVAGGKGALDTGMKRAQKEVAMV
ncbi:hypothetical protein FNF29_04256 [Cafeteria roenbergensis]|uniref:TmcB/TmcC TPR repeats domain-containing protein n=1 Tax=Cafeteria roenbergensis TaxID=33653 RepID=A0A5A8CI96_CAFRO|nr:hypothetical protein FNF29_04256 [Cafeteria roenbergensis]|eukprot:KAA0151850.1 hypothetical protein FNF29_04256 [Cafeteria roenbergensis]